MKVPMLSAVALVLVTSASWLGRAEAQHGGHKGGGGGAPKVRPQHQHPPKAGGAAHRPAMPKAKAQHPPKAVAGAPKPAMPKAKAQHPPKAEGSTHKPGKKDQKEPGSPRAGHEAKKNQANKKEEKASKADVKKHVAKKEPAKKKAGRADGGHDPESISLLHAAHQRLHEADHDYGGHRYRALEHVGSALGHLGVSAPSIRTGTGRSNRPQSVSDTILREARSTLETTRNRLASLPAAAAGHGHARGAVDAAIREIDLALVVR